MKISSLYDFFKLNFNNKTKSKSNRQPRKYTCNLPVVHHYRGNCNENEKLPFKCTKRVTEMIQKHSLVVFFIRTSFLVDKFSSTEKKNPVNIIWKPINSSEYALDQSYKIMVPNLRFYGRFNLLLPRIGLYLSFNYVFPRFVIRYYCCPNIKYTAVGITNIVFIQCKFYHPWKSYIDLNGKYPPCMHLPTIYCYNFVAVGVLVNVYPQVFENCRTSVTTVVLNPERLVPRPGILFSHCSLLIRLFW